MSVRLSDYVDEKIEVFRQLCIPLTPEEIRHMRTLGSEIAIDNYARDLIVKGMEKL